MRKLLALLLLLAPAAWAQEQQFPSAMNTYLIENQASGAGVSNFVFATPNSVRRALASLTVVNGAAAGFAMLFDGTALPSNGAVTACTSAATARPCYVWCEPMVANTSLSRNWTTPLRFTTGIVAAYSSTSCASITASATAQFFGQAP